MITAWETLEHHQKLIAEKDTYTVLGQHCSRIFSDVSTIKIIHIRPNSEPYKAFESPVTEIALFTVHEGESKEKVGELVNTLSKAIDALGANVGAFGSAWGPVVENDNMLGLFIGWTSVEVLCLLNSPAVGCRNANCPIFQAHQKAVTSDQRAVDLIANIRKLADVAVLHVKLDQWV